MEAKKIPMHPGFAVDNRLKHIKMRRSMLADKIGVSRSLVTLICQGKTSISYDNAFKIQDAIQVSAEWLISLQSKHNEYLEKQKIIKARDENNRKR